MITNNSNSQVGIRATFALVAICALSSWACAPNYRLAASNASRLIPAEEFSKATNTGEAKDFSIFRAAKRFDEREETRARMGNQSAANQIVPKTAPIVPAAMVAGTGDSQQKAVTGMPYSGDPKFLAQGFQLKNSMPITSPSVAEISNQHGAIPPGAELPAGPPVGSSSPYYLGQMTANPSLWPDESQGSTLFRDFRAFQSMDVITIVVNENSEGRKKAKTDNKTEFSLVAAISHFFGFEAGWASNNEGLDPENLVGAETSTKFKGEGETNRTGTFKARLSAVIMEVLPNGLLRVEGTKIIAVNDEEEVMVLSGLIRERDIDALNQVDSARIANMRIDFYGRGVVAEQTSPGWATRIFQNVWPF